MTSTAVNFASLESGQFLYVHHEVFSGEIRLEWNRKIERTIAHKGTLYLCERAVFWQFLESVWMTDRVCNVCTSSFLNTWSPSPNNQR